MTTLLVTGTDASIGKTAIALGIARIAAADGTSVGYMKPKGTRPRSTVGKTIDEDPMLARSLLDVEAEMHDLEPVVYSPTFVENAVRGQADPDELADRIVEAFDQLAADRDLMVVEGGGRWSTGGIVDLTDPEVADLLDARVLLVADYETPGDLDDVLAATDAIGDRLAGVMFNRVTDTAFDSLDGDAIPFLESRGVPVLGAVPRERELAGVTVAELADKLGAEVLTDGPTDAFVERFLVGAMSGESALRHFRRARNAAVVTGGDRSDVQTAALDATGVACLVLTGGHRPSGAVLGKAADAETPVLSVAGDTATTVDRAEDVVSRGRVRSVDAIERMSDLLQAHAELDRVLP